MSAATAAADPPDEPPGTRVLIAWIPHRMKRRILVRRAHRELVAIQLPSTTAPAASSRATAVQS